MYAYKMPTYYLKTYRTANLAAALEKYKETNDELVNYGAEFSYTISLNPNQEQSHFILTTDSNESLRVILETINRSLPADDRNPDGYSLLRTA